MPKISVVIPAYNNEETIARTIASVLNQTFADFELIIINDGSQDATLDIINQFEDARIKVFSYPNQGTSASRNSGISHSTGEYVSFLDADDIWLPEKLEMQLKVLQENLEAKVAYSWIDYIDENDDFIVSGSHQSFSGEIYEQLLMKNFLENGSNPLIEKQALLKVGEFDKSVFGSEDWDMWLRLAYKFKFVAVPKVQILYRIRENSGSCNVTRQEKVCLEVLQRAYTRLPSKDERIWNASHKNIYRYLTCKALEKPLNREKGWIAARCLWNYVKYDSYRLQNINFIFRLFIKIFLIIFLPNDSSTVILTSFKKLTKSKI